MRGDKWEAVLPPLRTLAAYVTHKSFISLVSELDERNFSFFPPERGRPTLPLPPPKEWEISLFEWVWRGGDYCRENHEP
jgi:hypothetical protein